MSSISVLEEIKGAEEFLVVGKGVRRIDALDKVTGRARFTGDFVLKDALHVRLVKSPIPHGRIIEIDVERALSLGPVRVFTAADIPGENQVGYALPDQPLLPADKVRYVGEPVALVAAPDEDLAEKAAELVEVRYEELPAVFDPLEAMERSDVLVHKDRGTNIAEMTRVRKGDVERGFEESDVVVENTYRTGHQEHAPLETEGAVAIPDTQGGVTVIASIQYPHLCQRITARVLGLPHSMVRVVQPYVGGAFGGKDDMGPIVSAMAGLVAVKTGRPAVLVYSRKDSFTSTCKRDPSIVRYKTGATRDGKLKAIEVEIILDSGAYANRGPYVLWRATMHAGGPYEIPNAKVDGFLVYTNKVFEGSFRGFGNPQVQFAAESQLDELAERLGMNPLEIRLKNLLRPGSRTITDQLLESSVGIYEAVKLLGERTGFRAKWREYRRERAGRVRRGIGIACGYHGISTSRGVPDWSNATVILGRDGSVTVETGICEIGQGSWTAHAQIAAEVLGVPVERVKVVGGTSDAPDTGATHASRGSSIGGIGVYVAAKKLRERLAEAAAAGVRPLRGGDRGGKGLPQGQPRRLRGVGGARPGRLQHGLRDERHWLLLPAEGQVRHGEGAGIRVPGVQLHRQRGGGGGGPGDRQGEGREGLARPGRREDPEPNPGGGADRGSHRPGNGIRPHGGAEVRGWAHPEPELHGLPDPDLARHARGRGADLRGGPLRVRAVRGQGRGRDGAYPDAGGHNERREERDGREGNGNPGHPREDLLRPEEGGGGGRGVIPV